MTNITLENDTLTISLTDVPVSRVDVDLYPDIIIALDNGALNDEIGFLATGKYDAAEGKEWVDSLRSLNLLRVDNLPWEAVVCEAKKDGDEFYELVTGLLGQLPEAGMTRQEREVQWGQAMLKPRDDWHDAADNARDIAGELSPSGDVWARGTRFLTDNPGGRVRGETMCPSCFLTVPVTIMGDYGVCSECESGIAPPRDSLRSLVVTE